MTNNYICGECGGKLNTTGGSYMTPTRTGFTVHTICTTCGKRFTIFLDTNMQEIRRRETMLKKPSEKARTVTRRKPTTICMKCQKARGGPKGCSWFNGFKPVEGWEAIQEQIPWAGTHKGKDTYTVLKCPEFVADKKKAGA